MVEIMNTKSLFYLCIALCMLLACGGAWGMKKGRETDVYFNFDPQPEEKDKAKPKTLINSMPLIKTNKMFFVNSLVKTFQQTQKFVSDMQSFRDILRKSQELKTRDNLSCFVECINKDEVYQKRTDERYHRGVNHFVEPEQRIIQEIKVVEGIISGNTLARENEYEKLQKERELLKPENIVNYEREICNSMAGILVAAVGSLVCLSNIKSGWQLPRSICLTASILSGVTGVAFLWHYIKKQRPYRKLKKVDKKLEQVQCDKRFTDELLLNHHSLEDLKKLQDILSKKKREQFDDFWNNYNQPIIVSDKETLENFCRQVARGGDLNFLHHIVLLAANLHDRIKLCLNSLNGDPFHYPASWSRIVHEKQDNNIEIAMEQYENILEKEYKTWNPSFKYDDKNLPKLSQEDQEILEPLKSLYEIQ
jgi:hypothetical protein